MAATWWVPMGPFDGSRQDMNTHTQMATHWEWPGDGHVDYWFAQINDSQPGHRSVGDLLPQSWHSGVGTQGKHRWAHKPPDLWKFQQHSFCVPALCCWLKTSQHIFKRSAIHSSSHQCYCLCICRSLLHMSTLLLDCIFFEFNYFIPKNLCIMALQNQKVWWRHIDINWKRKISENIQNIIHWTYNVLRC